MFDGRAFGAEIVAQVKAYVSRIMHPIEIRLAVLEAREPKPGDKGEPGLDGKDGSDGRDGINFDELDLAHDGERTMTLRFSRGELVKEWHLVFPVPIYRDVYQAGRSYARGDIVTFGGSMWHCNADTDDKPESGSPAWTLAAKRGRDGRDATIDRRTKPARQNGAVQWPAA